jgi:hypothetical protein
MSFAKRPREESSEPSEETAKKAKSVDDLFSYTSVVAFKKMNATDGLEYLKKRIPGFTITEWETLEKQKIAPYMLLEAGKEEFARMDLYPVQANFLSLEVRKMNARKCLPHNLSCIILHAVV